MKGSDTIMEEEQFRGDKKIDYTCTIISRPLPVQSYKSMLIVQKDGSGSKVSWAGNVKPKGAFDAKAKETIAEVQEAGPRVIADKSQ